MMSSLKPLPLPVPLGQTRCLFSSSHRLFKACTNYKVITLTYRRPKIFARTICPRTTWALTFRALLTPMRGLSIPYHILHRVSMTSSTVNITMPVPFPMGRHSSNSYHLSVQIFVPALARLQHIPMHPFRPVSLPLILWTRRKRARQFPRTSADGILPLPVSASDISYSRSFL
jgi:hypothetical protein